MMRPSKITSIWVLAAALLAACSGGGGGSSSGPNPISPQPSIRVVLDRPVVFLTAVGDSGALTAQVLDAQGTPTKEAVTWSSSAPDQVDVDAAGRVVARRIGSAQIFAEAQGVRSAPAFVVVAEPQPGALLVSDAQVVSVGPPLGLAPGAIPGVGTRYEVRLRGVSSTPAPGTVVLAAETSMVAGKVVATRAEADTLVVTLELAPLYELLARYRLDWTIDLAPYPLVAIDTADKVGPGAASSAAPQAAKIGAPVRPAGEVFEPFKAFQCDSSLKAEFFKSSVDLAVNNELKLVIQNYRDDPALPPSYSKYLLTGSESLEGSVKLSFAPGFKATGTCIANARFKLPVLGWLSVVVMPAVRIGAGVELEGKVEVVNGEVSVTGKVGASHELGWECGGADPSCRAIEVTKPINEFKHKLDWPRADEMHVSLSGHFFALVGLDAVVFTELDAKIVEARYGPKQSADLGSEGNQASNEGYASSYDLKLEGAVEPGDGLKEALKKLIDDDGVGVKYKGKFPTVDISESPKGTFTTSQSVVAINNPVDLTVTFQPATTDYYLLGYNIERVELWRKREQDSEFTFFRSFDFTQSRQSTFQYQWRPTADDIGKNRFAVFVATQFPVPLIEVEPNSVREVDVKCFSGGTAQRATVKPGTTRRATTDACADTWVGTTTATITEPVGTQTNNANVTWTVNPNYTVKDGEVAYLANGNLVVSHANLPGCTFTPTTFNIEPNAQTVLVVNYSVDPPTFYGSGQTEADVTLTCPNRPPQTNRWTFIWFTATQDPFGTGTVTENGTKITGTVTFPDSIYSYTFTRQ